MDENYTGKKKNRDINEGVPEFDNTDENILKDPKYQDLSKTIEKYAFNTKNLEKRRTIGGIIDENTFSTATRKKLF
jgi:hypothetical protein